MLPADEEHAVSFRGDGPGRLEAERMHRNWSRDGREFVFSGKRSWHLKHVLKPPNVMAMERFNLDWGPEAWCIIQNPFAAVLIGGNRAFLTLGHFRKHRVTQEPHSGDKHKDLFGLTDDMQLSSCHVPPLICAIPSGEMF